MRSIGFYSFKGGVGRTNLLLNIAYHLARTKSRHIGLMDLDLEAPGLTVLPCLAPPAITKTGGGNYPNKGLWDFLSEATAAMAEKKANTPVPEITEIFYETRLAHTSGGSIHLAPAYPYLLEQIPDAKNRGAIVYKKLKDSWVGGRSIGTDIFRFIGDQVREAEFPIAKQRKKEEKKLDYLLVDLRTGLTELADTALGSLFSELVFISGLNMQNTDGMIQALRTMAQNLSKTDLPAHGRIRVKPIFSPVPNGEIEAVREKLKTTYDRLNTLEEELRRQESPLHLLLPTEPDPGKKSAPAFQVIHYCDYLAVGDEVLLEQYPETPTAKELAEIAEEMTITPEDLTRQTEKTIQESISPPAKPEPDPLQIDPCWMWVFDYWRNVPDWRWPLHLFKGNQRDEQIILKRFPPDISVDVREKVISGLAASRSLDKAEKIRIIREFEELTDDQISSLLTIFTEEQNRVAETDINKARELAISTLNAVRGWVEILEILGAGLGAVQAMVSLFPGITQQVDTLPKWALLAAFCLKNKDRETSYIAIQTFLLNENIPPDVIVTIMDRIDNKTVQGFHEIREFLREWTRRAMTQTISLTCLNILGQSVLPKFKLYREAEIVLRNAIKIDPKSAYNWHYLGYLLATHLGRYEEAEKVVKKAIEINPNFAQPWNNLGYLLGRYLGRYEEAEKAIRNAVAIDPNFAFPWNNLGYLLANHSERYKEAEKAYRNAIAIDPNFARPWNNLGDLLSNHLERYSEAEKSYRKSIALSGAEAAYGNVNLLFLRMFEENEQGYEAQIKVIKNYLKGEATLDNRANLSLIHAILFCLTGKKEEAKNILQHLINKNLLFYELPGAWLCARIAGDKTHYKQLPEYTGRGIAAHELEAIIKTVAILSDQLNRSSTTQLKTWLRNTLNRFTPPAGSRPLNRKWITPFLKRIGMEREIDAE